MTFNGVEYFCKLLYLSGYVLFLYSGKAEESDSESEVTKKKKKGKGKKGKKVKWSNVTAKCLVFLICHIMKRWEKSRCHCLKMKMRPVARACAELGTAMSWICWTLCVIIWEIRCLFLLIFKGGTSSFTGHWVWWPGRVCASASSAGRHSEM